MTTHSNFALFVNIYRIKRINYFNVFLNGRSRRSSKVNRNEQVPSELVQEARETVKAVKLLLEEERMLLILFNV